MRGAVPLPRKRTRRDEPEETSDEMEASMVQQRAVHGGAAHQHHQRSRHAQHQPPPPPGAVPAPPSSADMVGIAGIPAPPMVVIETTAPPPAPTRLRAGPAAVATVDKKVRSAARQAACWQYFKELPGEFQAVCSVCGVSVACKGMNTTGMNRHLWNSHGIDIRQEKMGSSTTKAGACVTCGRSGSMSSEIMSRLPPPPPPSAEPGATAAAARTEAGTAAAGASGSASSLRVTANFSITPVGMTASISKHTAACVKILDHHRLEQRVHAFGINVEGEFDAVAAAVKECHEAVHRLGAARVHSNIEVGVALVVTVVRASGRGAVRWAVR